MKNGITFTVPAAVITEWWRSRTGTPVLGGDYRYRKFVGELPPAGSVHYWQSQMLSVLEFKHGLVLPREVAELRAVLPPLPAPPTLVAADVPAWLSIEELGGAAPVQGWGTAGSWRWYFRARHGTWSLEAVLGTDRDPLDIDDDAEGRFHAEDEYDDSSFMALDEARFVIFRELTRLRQSRGE